MPIPRDVHPGKGCTTGGEKTAGECQRTGLNPLNPAQMSSSLQLTKAGTQPGVLVTILAIASTPNHSRLRPKFHFLEQTNPVISYFLVLAKHRYQIECKCRLRDG